MVLVNKLLTVLEIVSFVSYWKISGLKSKEICMYRCWGKVRKIGKLSV